MTQTQTDITKQIEKCETLPGYRGLDQLVDWLRKNSSSNRSSREWIFETDDAGYATLWVWFEPVDGGTEVELRHAPFPAFPHKVVKSAVFAS